MHTMTPEFVASVGFSDDIVAKVTVEPRSRVRFDIEQLGEVCKLTVVHDGFEPGSTVAELVSQGRPHLLSALKTLLETGETLPAALAETAAGG